MQRCCKLIMAISSYLCEMKKKLLYMAGFFILLFLGFYFALARWIPGFGKPVLPVLSEVPTFSFTDQEGKEITGKDLAGKVYVAEYFFLTCRKDSLYHLARNGYLLDDPKNNLTNINEQFLHTQFIALVDRGGRVRKIYDGLKKDEMDELEKDIPVLLKEKASDVHLINGVFNNNPG